MSETYQTPRQSLYSGPPSGDLAMWQERREQAQRDRRRYEPVWAMCQAYVANKQWVGWSKRERRIVSEPNPQERERHTVNVLTSYLMTNVGKFAADDLLPMLGFRADDEEQEMFSKQANLAMEYAWYEEIDAEERLYDAFIRMCTFGIAGIQAGWSPTGPLIAENVPYLNGKPLLDPTEATQAVAASAQGGPKVEFRDVRGRCDWRVLSPHNILPPPGVLHERDFPWLIIERPVALDRLRSVYGDKADRITEQNLQAVDVMGARDVMSDDEGISQTATGRLRNHAILYTGYEFPSRRFPKGRTYIWVQDTTLDDRPKLPYEVSGEPMIGVKFFKYNMLPDRFWPIGLIEPGMGPQRQRNRSRSQYIEIKDRAGLGRIYTRPNSLNVNQLAGGKVMEVIEVRPGSEMPTETSGLGPGPWMAEDIAMHDSDIDKVMGMGQVTLGQGAPGGVSAYSAMALLAEQDDRRVGPIIRHIRNNVTWLVKFTLQDVRNYWGTQKQIALAGEDGRLQAFTFDATRMPPEVYVKVGRGAPSPRNQAAEIQKVFDLYDRAIAGGQPLPVQWLYESLEQGKAKPIPETPQMVQTQKAELENMLIARGGVATVDQTDDHDVHIREHTEAIIAHQFIPGAEEVVRALTEHRMEHEQAKQQASLPAASAPGLQGGYGAQGGSASGVQQPIPTLPARPAGGPTQ